MRIECDEVVERGCGRNSWRRSSQWEGSPWSEAVKISKGRKILNQSANLGADEVVKDAKAPAQYSFAALLLCDLVGKAHSRSDIPVPCTEGRCPRRCYCQ